jgi:hypothetical protein
MDWSKALKEAFDKPFALGVGGFIFCALVAAGALPTLNRPTDTLVGIGLFAVGISVFAVGTFIHFRGNQLKLSNAKKYGFKITSPHTNTEQVIKNGFFDIYGKYANEPPKGYLAVIIELLEPGGFAFRRLVDLNANDKTWAAKQVWCGLEPRKIKKFEIVLVGPNGNVLREYWEAVGEIYRYKIPPIETRMDDIITCDQLTIITKV